MTVSKRAISIDMAKTRILVIGYSSMDLVLGTEMIPEQDEILISGGSYEFAPGGKGANAAFTASMLGGDVMFCSRVGNDFYGNSLIKLYKENGINVRCINVDKKRPTGFTAIITEGNGKSRSIVYPGANAVLGEDDLEEAFMTYPDAVLLQFELPELIVRKAIEMANQKKIPVFIDACPGRANYPLYALGDIEVFSPNEVETYLYTGINPENLDDYIQSCVRLSSKLNAKYYVLKLGSRGAYIFDGKYSEIIPAIDVEIVDPSAAGDAFTAALTLEYLRSKNISRAVKFANIVGALTVSKKGASSSLPDLIEVKRFMEQKGLTLI